MNVEIDFKRIKSYTDFYRQLKNQLNLPHYFGNNLDALYDSLSGYTDLPLEIRFVNFNGFHQNAFVKLIEIMKGLAEEVGGFKFEIEKK